MSDDDTLVYLGIALLIVGGIALVWGQMSLMEVNDSMFGGFQFSDQQVRNYQLARLGGLVVGAIGGVLTVTGGLQS
ncbi:hypothetical protein [Halorarius halobius]|uniref:hypothetical protein n=1 Tax=Halorarius halobius TaxID=2962671 RepID=UPI0020CB97F7|nr:hypothetical protein [Halorarius halobius]